MHYYYHISWFFYFLFIHSLSFRKYGRQIYSHIALVKRPVSILSDSASDATTAAYDFMQSQGQWYSMSDCSVLLPRERTPKSIIHFVGGFVAGSASQITYGKLLTTLSNNGHLICVSPIPAVDLNHTNIAEMVSTSFTNCYNTNLKPILGSVIKDVPIFGLSHSLGGKIIVLLHSNKKYRKVLPPRAANIFLSFNNYGIEENIELGKAQGKKASPEVQKILEALDRPEVQKIFEAAKNNKMVSDFFKKQSSSSSSSSDSTSKSATNSNTISDAGRMLAGMVSSLSDQLGIDMEKKISDFTDFSKDTLGNLEFTPTAEETWKILLDGYNVQKNVLFKFDEDDIDQSNQLAVKLIKRGCETKIKILPGKL